MEWRQSSESECVCVCLRARMYLHKCVFVPWLVHLALIKSVCVCVDMTVWAVVCCHDCWCVCLCAVFSTELQIHVKGRRRDTCNMRRDNVNNMYTVVRYRFFNLGWNTCLMSTEINHSSFEGIVLNAAWISSKRWIYFIFDLNKSCWVFSVLFFQSCPNA